MDGGNAANRVTSRKINPTFFFHSRKAASVNTQAGSDTMKTTQIAQYALRLTYSQPANREKMMSRSAFALAAIGLGLSTFSVRQMVLHQTRRI
ncbi:hypothetical protein evm_005629 [Chilo suppressalis]|nr:hypothetical protein evm_005629 [Chilo suppressalis]